mgnify:CR=1 FL=1
MRKLFIATLKVAIIPVTAGIIIFGIVTLLSWLGKIIEPNIMKKHREEVEKIKSLDVKDMACIKEVLYVKEGDKLLRQAQSCDLYNADIYLREGTELTKLGIKN